MPGCANCERGPSGIAGHDELFSQSMAPDLMHFKCRSCERKWVRQQTPAGYKWAPPSGEPFGVDTPGKPGMTPP